MRGVEVRKTAQALPPQGELLKWFRYDAETGILYRIAIVNANTGKRRFLASERIAGNPSTCKYLRCRIPGIGYAAVSRIIWVIQTGIDPAEKEVDHINMDKQDNRWCNLRLAERSQNLGNRRKQATANGVVPLSHYKGVSYKRDRHGRPVYIFAQIRVNGKRIHLGMFPTEELAHAAYCNAAKHYFGEYARNQ